MNSYRITYEIDIEADSPLDAAKAADWFMQKENRHWDPIFRVRNVGTGEKYRVDLDDKTCIPLKSKKKAK